MTTNSQPTLHRSDVRYDERFSETSPLLHPTNPTAHAGLNDAFYSRPTSFRTLISKELNGVLALAWPVSLATVFRLLIFSTDTAFIGQLGTKQLAGASLAQVVQMITIVYIYGASSALNTLGSQALGAGNPKLVGVWLQISFVVITILALPTMVALFYARPIVALVESDEEVLHFVDLFAKWSILPVWPLAWYSCVRQYFQSQRIVLPATIVSLISLPINVGYNQLFIHGIPNVFNGFGFIGGPMATAATVTTQLVTYCVYMFWYRKLHVPTWPGLSWQHFTWQRLQAHLGIALPLGIAIVCDESVFQSLVLMAGRFTEVDVDAMGVLFQVFGIVWAIWWGLGLATQVAVGRHLGEGNPRQAKASAAAGLLCVIVTMTLISGLSLMSSDYMARPFSKDPAVADLVSSLVPFLQISLWLYVLGMTIGSMLEGMAKMATLSIASFVFAYGGTLPASYLFAFNLGQHVRGLWVGPMIGDGCKLLFFIILLAFFIDWSRQAKRARQRAETDPDDDEGYDVSSDEGISTTVNEDGSDRQALLA
eukprot:TRINITY_DN6334_c0_g1_i1.p1 TRINITY_DN6334_c0_g1~~TRINITY_DN6334_c0_g1_i1.p1  ORF type:complete len:538 (+),score=75.22 TRINITY_DN6334_c0_g1_i1:160-1773(+)